jgi:hypothetical protein
MSSKARKLHLTKFEGFPEGEDIVITKTDKVYYTFDDGSIAYLLTRLEECEPYLTPSLSTMRVKRVAYWQAV